MKRCLRCYAELTDEEVDFHLECAQEIFGTSSDYTLSPSLEERYDISTDNAELADLTLRLAQAVAILTVPHTLVKGDDGTLSALTKRLDVGLSGEDCDVDTMRLILDEESDAYRNNGSYEQIIQIIEDHSTVAKLDILNFWEQLAFAWVVGCDEMGLLSFSLYQPHRGLYSLAPAYDMCATAVLHNTEEGRPDDLKLTLNRKRNNITRADFEVPMKRSGLKERAIKGVFNRFVESQDRWCEIIDNSFISDDLKTRLKEFIASRIKML